MITTYHYQQASTASHLQQISALQVKNLKRSLSDEEIKQEGFVTCEHSIELLTNMNHPDGHVIASADNDVVGYCLVMSPLWRDEIEVLKPMFERIDELKYKDTPLKEASYVVMGQVCIDKVHRQQGIFRSMYHHFKDCLRTSYDICITEIASDNIRSRDAHEAIGFKTLDSFRADNGQHWELVIWDWRS